FFDRLLRRVGAVRGAVLAVGEDPLAADALAGCRQGQAEQRGLDAPRHLWPLVLSGAPAEGRPQSATVERDRRLTRDRTPTRAAGWRLGRGVAGNSSHLGETPGVAGTFQGTTPITVPARFSPDRRHRYELWRRWGDGVAACNYLPDPSTVDRRLK